MLILEDLKLIIKGLKNPKKLARVWVLAVKVDIAFIKAMFTKNKNKLKIVFENYEKEASGFVPESCLKIVRNYLKKKKKKKEKV